MSTHIRHDGRFKDGKPLVPPAVKRELRKLENSLDAGQSYESKTLDQMLELVEQDYAVAGYRSIGPLKSRLKHIREWFGNLRGRHIQDNDLFEYAAWRQRAGAKNNTIRLEFQTILKALRMGKVHPLPEPPELKRPGPREGFFDDTMIRCVCRHLPDYLRPAAWFGYYTGWRKSEVTHRQIKDIDFVAGEIRLWTSKNELARVFPMDVVPGLRELLVETIQANHGDVAIVEGPISRLTPYVFYRKLKSGKVRAPVEIRKAWDTACRKAGYPGMHFHDLRRSAARNLENVGWPRSLIMQWMGHETESMFHYYRIVSAADQAIVAERIKAMKAVGKPLANRKRRPAK